MTDDYDFDVAISFAGEDRDLVREVADALKEEGVRTFFDEDFAVDMWGEDLVEYFTAIYGKRARYMLMFISRHYAEKAWPGQERRAGLARALESDDAYILPVRLDDVDPPPGMRTTTGYLDARRIGVTGLAIAVTQKLRGTPGWDGKTPRLRRDIDSLLRQRPDFWEYYLWAGTLYIEMQGLQDKYLDHEVGYSPATGESVAEHEVAERMHTALNELGRIVAQVDPVFREDVQRRAFGEPGQAGSPERIQHLARRMAATYEDLLDWSLSIRGIAVPGDFQEAYALLAHLANQPITEYRAFVDEVVEQIDKLAELGEDGTEDEPVEVTLELTLTMNEQDLEAYRAEMGRLVGDFT